ncbi:sigma-70 family RNA polymerase sigma factor [Agreia sp. PsM10]|uniref:sigma-70 family RNA polymerase sigma factor n=1 Tax=Agreia sp. PsM10 TaxID=3030533 RepID=UPI00263AD9B0|nr:sigma-70 family RNA polymerase sigma factor [Agreia sp. PsM10]MDN4641162.1 sigma-70 family RNA polymerase sigma factor [Agreia sp. PsM10]
MAAHLDPPARPLADASDMELVEFTRAGNSAAFGELWVRHSNAGRAVARSHRFDADDLLSEAFARVFQAISAGGGPTTAFRPYLFTTIRNVSMQWARAKSADASEDLDLIADPSTEEDASLAALDKSLTVNAFRSLPTRWQEALWYSEVEQLSSAEIAPLLGMKANAVSALTYRAREGLRQAWIQAHLRRTTDPECAAAIERLGSFTRGTLGARESKRVRDHLAGCTSCTIVADEARQVGSRLALVLLPLAAGVSGAAGFLSWMQAGSGTAGGLAAAATMPADLTASGSSSASANSSASSSGGTSAAAVASGIGAAGIVGSAVGALALAAAVVAAVTLGPGLFATPADDASSADLSSDSAATDPGDSRSGSDTAVVADPAPAPTTSPAPTTEPAPAPEPTRPGPPGSPTKPAVAPEPSPNDSPAPSTPAEPSTPPVVTPAPPPVEPEPAPAAPTVVIEQAADHLTFPVFSGTAEPLSSVQILDTDGNPLVSTTAADDGTWSISDFGESITGDPAGREVVVRQVVDGVESDPSAPQHLVVLEAPVIETPLEGDSVPVGSTYEIVVSGVPGASIQRIVNGAVREDIHALDGDGLWSQIYGAPTAGPIELGMRYYDPDSGRFGLTRVVTYMLD